MSGQTPETEDQPPNQALVDAENYIREACEMLQLAAKSLHQEQEAMDSKSKKPEDRVYFPSPVKLNVGGHLFTTSLQTLTKDPNSMLAVMFSAKFEKKPSEDGTFFIDRDGTHFRFILNYLRNGELILPEGATFLEELGAEAEFYQIHGILDELKPKILKDFNNSEILTNEEHRRVLKYWLSPHEGKWRLLFRGSRDGFAAAIFHSKCDNQGPTVTIVKSGNNIFGGFTELSWGSGGAYSGSSQTFLFSMVNPHALGPTKVSIKDDLNMNAIYCHYNYGPTFGGGFDLHISGNPNTTTSSYSNLGHSYECPSGQEKTFFAGADSFSVTDYEVFGLHN